MSAVHTSTESRQDYATPRFLVDLIAKRFGVEFSIDLAASDLNRKAIYYIGEKENSLTCDWATMIKAASDNMKHGCAWLNPPFKRADPWMEKCKTESAKGCKIISLTLSSLGSNWYRDHVEGHAMVYILRRRVAFVGCDQPYTKELMIALWGFGMTGLGYWDWAA